MTAERAGTVGAALERTCDASQAIDLDLAAGPSAFGPCVLRNGHDGPVHKDGNGKEWWPTATGPHHYLSTGCLHGEHDYCQGKTGMAGAKMPAKCKFCDARCECGCHRET